MTYKAMDLVALLGAINGSLGREKAPYGERGPDGQLVPNVGTYTLDHDATGWRLEIMVSGGGSRNISPRLKKTPMGRWLSAFAAGIDANRNVG